MSLSCSCKEKEANQRGESEPKQTENAECFIRSPQSVNLSFSPPLQVHTTGFYSQGLDFSNTHAQWDL